MSTRPPRRAVPLPRLLAAAAVAAGALWLADRQVDRWRYPWADAASGRPLLLGLWVGGLTTGGGRPRAVLLRVVRERPGNVSGRCRTCDDGVEGAAMTCDERGRVWRYRFSGRPEDRRATRIAGGVQPAASPAPDGLTLGAVRGGWDGADALDLEAEFYWRRGPSAVSGTADPDTRGWVPRRMRRGTEADFRARCARIRGPALPEPPATSR